MYLSDIHTHSIASGHGTTCTISDMAKEASHKGLKIMVPRLSLPGLPHISEVFHSVPKNALELMFFMALN